MKVLIFGASGMVGQGVLRECLLSPDVELVATIGRTPAPSPLPGSQPAAWRQIHHSNLSDLTGLRAELTGFDACFFTLGVSSIETDYQTRNKLQWKDVQKKLFPSGTPTRAIWEQRDIIIDIMQQLSETDDLNHMFLPTGGGMNLLGARCSYEEGCIELDVGMAIILKPKRLVFESFNFEEEWNYFRLETSRLSPSGYYDEVTIREALTELEPLIYTDFMCFEFNDYNGQDLPRGARQIDRMLAEVSFVIFQNSSMYSNIAATYDARHNKMTTDEFRTYIGNTVRHISGTMNNIPEQSEAITLCRPSSFKLKQRLLTSKEIVLLRDVASLARERKVEELELLEKSGMGTFIDLLNTDFFSAPRPKSDRLKDYLRNLPQEQIVLIAAVMYGGREGTPPLWGTPLDELIMDLQNRPNLILSICEKLPLADYIERGITIYT